MRDSTNKSPTKIIATTRVICLRMGKTTSEKPHRVNLRSPLVRIYYYQNKQLQVKGIPVSNTNLQLNPYSNTQLDLFYSDNLSFSMHDSQYVTNQSDAQILVRGLLLCTNPSTWLTPQQPFDCCSWFATASHRNTNKIFNVGARDLAWL